MTDIQTCSQAAEALRPIAGAFTFVIFAAGIVGTGLLAVPVLAGSSAYAVSEVFRWNEGLDRKLFQAKSFYATIAVLTLAGVALNFTALGPGEGPVLERGRERGARRPRDGRDHARASNGRNMGRLTLSRPMLVGGWLATAVMTAASIGFFVI